MKRKHLYKPKTKAKNATLPSVTEEFIHSLRGCCKGEESLVEAREREHREESFAERRLGK